MINRFPFFLEKIQNVSSSTEKHTRPKAKKGASCEDLLPGELKRSSAMDLELKTTIFRRRANSVVWVPSSKRENQDHSDHNDDYGGVTPKPWWFQ